ncbi:MAG: hypothetical protein CGU28_07340 [Candidatus Dactylopiibacterium carminicum]|uniref:NAD(P)/FAD-dependent oxidoreductase n=1 Tax=Candidatus Dactylopiibacterium carminicum TaxID=857335 RepID=A0A272EUL7_9RHOO|nr:NAD(P)/FAD-dependent oxidoreductase [Candidatus Dactylopiibacterium carminicum]KAF7600373.1 NAD(P)/FAD-dependent oxidoreductase [Candidatus Dactylopiibacterium carminicum]PAS93798.1 MAG: hypothetical protein CGU29_06060 [Candidatus Dactylopiibacterium carminicum]PAS96836.1 MAG: hypothetical protein CGU28_07340 [Candidatus Dactylopiibacterium carminicum]PAT00373.1 MAG: hypothetical protein BSR46_03085 [Candidatus Dactylopiibacterium carminicum]
MDPRPASRRICILGSGPAGLSCALWAHNLGLDPKLIELNAQSGGAMQVNFLTNEWVLGHRGMTGQQLAANFVAHVEALGIPILYDSRPTNMERLSDGNLQITLDTPHGISGFDAGAVVIATGTRFRARETLLSVPGFAQCDQGRMRFGPHCFTHIETLAGQRLLIIGGGDNAFENATLAHAAGAHVTVVARSVFHAQERFMTGMRTAGAKLHEHARLANLRPAPSGLLTTLETPQGNIEVEVDRLHLLAGYQPNTEFLSAVFGASIPPLQRDTEGYLQVDAQCRCSQPGFYAAGDVCNRLFPSVVSAISQGAQAARQIELDYSAPY